MYVISKITSIRNGLMFCLESVSHRLEKLQGIHP